MNKELITSNLGEIIGAKELEDKSSLKVYWGTSPTGKPHIGYLIPLIKIAEMIKGGCEFTILFADLHAYLDAMKSTLDVLEHRTAYYNKLIRELLKLLNVDITKINFVNGMDFQLSKQYTLDVYKFLGNMTVDAAQKAGADVVKQSKNPMLSSITYPLLQVLDEKYLNVDAQLGGIDQRKIFMMSRDHCHKINHKPIIYFMNHLLPKLDKPTNNAKDEITLENKMTVENKMSSSDIAKINFLDNAKTIKKKINKAFASPKELNTPLLFMMQYIIFPILNLQNNNKFVINRDEKYGGVKEYDSLTKLTDDYESGDLAPQDLKLGISDFMIKFLEPLHSEFDTDEMKELLSKAYPN